MEAQNDWVIAELSGPIAAITMNRPQRHNSLVPAFLRQLLAAFEAVPSDGSVQAVILQANGRSFSTGGDVAGFYQHLPEIEAYALETVGLLNQLILTMVALPVPVVAAVHGIVTGGSLGLVLAADEVLLAPAASFTPYYCVVGFSPDGGWTAMLPRLIGTRRTAEVINHNRTINAEKAVAWGIANRIIAADQIRSEALWLAKDIAAKQTGSIMATKELFKEQHGDLASRLDKERARFARQVVTPEAEAGMRRFLKLDGAKV